MTDRHDAAWRRIVGEYDIEVPPERIENERAYITLEMKHRMQYDRLSGGGQHLFAQAEIDEQREAIEAAALFEAKAPLVVKDIVARQQLTASPEELEQEARELAQREGATMEMVKGFFGDDLKMLEDDVLERKAIGWAIEHLG